MDVGMFMINGMWLEVDPRRDEREEMGKAPPSALLMNA